MHVSIDEWTQPLEVWPELASLVEALGQTRWVTNSYFDWHLGRHLYVAVSGGLPVGFLLTIIQNIGDDEKHDRFLLAGSNLTEAKVLAFGVPPESRRSGIGRQLQLFAMGEALAEGCYQFRSRSDGDATENHVLKSRMGFAIHPADRSNDRKSAFFVMPLQIWRDHLDPPGKASHDHQRSKSSISVGEWSQSSPHWGQLGSIVDSLEQTRWVFDTEFSWHLERHMYVASFEDRPVGYLLTAIQYIGDDDEHDRFELDGTWLREAKVMAFGVLPEFRAAGIGRRLQLFAMEQALTSGCYQFRSRSDGPAVEHHVLKSKMGFGIHPAARPDDNKSAYFLMPLRIWSESLQ